jgi:hypothetical protein
MNKLKQNLIVTGVYAAVFVLIVVTRGTFAII